MDTDRVLVFQNRDSNTEFSAPFVVPNGVTHLSRVTGSNAFFVTPDGSATLDQLIVNRVMNGLVEIEVMVYWGGGAMYEINFPVIPGRTLFVVMFGDTTAFLHFSAEKSQNS